MLKLFLTILILNSLTALSQGRWEVIPSPTTNFLRKIVASDSNTIWAAGHNGTIIKSSDQGNTWTTLPTNTNNIIMNLSAVSNTLIFAISWELNNPPYGTYIIKSTNGGLNWQSQYFPIEYELLQSIYFFNENVGMVAGSRTYYTTNGGLSWSIAQRDSDLVATLPFLEIKMLNQNLGFACGGFIDVAGVIWKTTNGGLNWKTNGVSPDEIFDMVVLDSLNIFALAGDPEFIYQVAFVKSTDGGESWTYNELPIYAVSLGIDAKDRNTFWAAGGYNFIYSTNAGNTWMLSATPDSVSIYDLIFINNRKGFACGENGVLLKYVEESNNVKEENSTLEGFYLYQNYPNPVYLESSSTFYNNSSTTISWQTPEACWQTLKIYDMLGREIATLVDEYREAGKHSKIYSVHNINSPKDVSHTLPSGVYIYQLRAGNYVESRKMLIAK